MIIQTYEYERPTSFVKTNRGWSEWFKTKSGVQQGTILSPTWFNIIMSEKFLKKEEEEEEKKTHSQILVYEDDAILWTNNAKELEETLNRVNNGLS